MMQLSVDYMAHTQSYLEEILSAYETEYTDLCSQMKTGEKKIKG
jgi:hypothetical protein